MMWPGAATCACDRAQHATKRGAQPSSPLPSRLLPSPDPTASLLWFFPRSAMEAQIHRPLPLHLHHCSPSASIADHPASATVPSPTLPLYSISLAEPHRGDSPASPSSSSSSPLSTTRHCSRLRLHRRQPRLSHRRLSPTLSLSFLLDPPSASLHCVFHRRSLPRSPPLSTVGRLPLLPLRCTPISATTIVTTPAFPLPSPGVVAIFQPHRSPASPFRRHHCRHSKPPPSLFSSPPSSL